MKRLSVLLLLLMLAACGDEEFQDLREFVENSGKDLRGKVDPPPEIKPYEPFTYDNETGLPDPFKPHKSELLKGTRGGQNQPDFDRPKEELEEFPLDSMRMVGYLFQKGVAYAVIRTSDGKLHRVREGNYLGQNFGKIVSISEAEIRIKEMVQDSAGDWSERETTLQLIE